MKRTILLTAAILCAASIRAQDLYNIKEPPATEILSRPVEAGRIHRTEVVPYDKRHDADAATAQASKPISPTPPKRSRPRTMRWPSGR